MARTKIEQNDPQGQTLKSHLPDMQTGVHYQISIYQPSIIVDCHMHIQSGNCATLPFMWEQAGPLSSLRMKRVTLQTNAGRVDAAQDSMNAWRKSAHTTENMAATADQKELYRTHKLRTTLDVSKHDTYKIADTFMNENRADVFDNYLSKEPLYTEAPHLMFMAVVMTMDMEYAHLDGYFGLKVCNAIYERPEDILNDKDPIAYWTPFHKQKDREFGGKTYQERQDQRKAMTYDQTQAEFDEEKEDLDKQGIPGVYYDDAERPYKVNVQAEVMLLDGEAGVAAKTSQQPDDSNLTARYEQWKKQVQHTELAMLAHPLKLLPLFHYDPRRWQTQDTKNAQAFEQVTGSGLFLGFKMYTAQGYRPWEPRLPVLKHFYARCVTDRIPILNHCTPAGAPTFDRKQYLDFQHPNDGYADEVQKKDPDTGYLRDGRKAPPRVLGALEYFNRNFVAPKAWEKVLKEHPTLRICLAHFGGNTRLGREWFMDILNLIREYPNVYTDISSSFCSREFRDFFKEKVLKDKEAFDKKIRHRILFGSDWYLTLLDGRDYREYCETAKNFLDDMDTSLWIRFTQANPYNFYRLNEEIERIAGNIVDRRQKDRKTVDFFGGDPITQEKIDGIYKEAAYIKIANKFFEKYEEF